MAHRPFDSTPISGSGTAVIAAGAGVLHQVIVTSAGTSLDIYDHPSAAAGKKVANVGATVGTFTFDQPYNTGITLSATGSYTATVITRQRRA